MNVTAKDSKSTPKKAEDATRYPLALLNIWPGDRVKVIGNTVPDEEEDYRGSLGMVRKIDPAEALPLFVFVDQADEEFGAVQFIAEELEVVTPGPISTYIAALRAQAEAEAELRAENAVLRAFVEAFANEDGCGCGYGRELLDAYGAAYELMWPEPALAQAGGES